MPDLTMGYQGPGRGNMSVVDAIFRHAPLNVALPAHWLPKAAFTNNFMPYAKIHWSYDGSNCNCEDLSSALWAFWSYIVSSKRPQGLDPLPRAEKTPCSAPNIITRALPVFAGPAFGNIRHQQTNSPDGRCLFPVHWVFQVGRLYLDPTFDRITENPTDLVIAHYTRLTPNLFRSEDQRYLYARNPIATDRFSDSFNELDAAGWLPAQEWKSRTARSLHTRSMDLINLDRALAAFEQQGYSAFAELQSAFRQWVQNNHKEAAARNAGDCVVALGAFLGVQVQLQQVVGVR